MRQVASPGALLGLGINDDNAPLYVLGRSLDLDQAASQVYVCPHEPARFPTAQAKRNGAYDSRFQLMAIKASQQLSNLFRA